MIKAQLHSPHGGSGSPMIGEEESQKEDVFGNTKPIDYITHSLIYIQLLITQLHQL